MMERKECDVKQLLYESTPTTEERNFHGFSQLQGEEIHWLVDFPFTLKMFFHSKNVKYLM
jgi:hypothetical protein